MIRLASSEVHATNGKRSGPTSKPRWLRTALTGAGLGTEKRALTLGINLRWIVAAVLRSLFSIASSMACISSPFV